MPQPTNDASRSRLADVMFKFFWLTLRPVERFLAQCVSISTAPTAFARERIHLGDTTNFLRAAGFFVSAISTAFLAEVATLYLLGIGNLTEPYYWLFILLTSIPFVLICFLLIKLVAPLPFRDVLHLSFYPIGAGVFTGAALALVAAAVVALLAATGYIHEIRYDFTQWGGLDAGPPLAVYKRALYDCLRKESLAYTVLTSGLQIAYDDLKPPIDNLSYLRPVITVLYLVIAACFFMTAVDHRKSVVFGIVLLAALVATGANILSLRTYFSWKLENSDCGKKLGQIAMDRLGASALKEMARGVQASVKDNEVYDVSVGAEGHTISYAYRFKRPWPNPGAFSQWLAGYHARTTRTLF